MRTKEILRSDWREFFNGFSRQHQGWLVTLEILGTEIGAQIEERELAFEGIVADCNEVRGDEIAIMIGARPDDHITHSISRPTYVSLEQTDEGADVALAIKAENETTTLLSFRVAVLPESADAVSA